MRKKIGNILLWLIMLVYLIIVFTFVGRKEEGLVCRNIHVRVVDSARNSFVSQSDISSLVRRNYDGVEGAVMSSVDKGQLEDLIDHNPSIKKSEVYSTLTGNLQIDVEQRKPILRVFGSRKGFYIDREGKVMPLSRQYTSRVLVASGKISKELAKGDLFELALFIHEDDFWNSMIDQVHVTRDGEYILIPRVGAQKIVLGQLKGYPRKFKKLFALYRDGFSRTGWNQYKKINLKFKNQVVCTKK